MMTGRLEALGTSKALAAAALETFNEPLGPDRDAQEIERLAEVCAILVCRYAPGAPMAVRREAVIRCMGWLLESQPAAITRIQSVSERAIEYTASQWSPLRHSGAMAILSPWKVRRGGAI